MIKFLLTLSVCLFIFVSKSDADHWGKPKLNGPGPWDQNISVLILKRFSTNIWCGWRELNSLTPTFVNP